MTIIRRTTRWGADRLRNWSAGFRGGRDMARRYSLLDRLANLGRIRRLMRRRVPLAATL